MNYAEYYPQYKISKSCQISNDILEKVIESICYLRFRFYLSKWYFLMI